MVKFPLWKSAPSPHPPTPPRTLATHTNDLQGLFPPGKTKFASPCLKYHSSCSLNAMDVNLIPLRLILKMGIYIWGRCGRSGWGGGAGGWRGVCIYSSWPENGPLAFWPHRKKVSPRGWTWSSWTTRRLVAHHHGGFCRSVRAVSALKTCRSAAPYSKRGPNLTNLPSRKQQSVTRSTFSAGLWKCPWRCAFRHSCSHGEADQTSKRSLSSQLWSLVCVSHSNSLRTKASAKWRKCKSKSKNAIAMVVFTHVLYPGQALSKISLAIFQTEVAKKKRKNGYFLAVIAQLCDKKTFVCVR